MSACYKFGERGLLQGYCILEGADRFVRVEGKAWLNVDELARSDSKLFSRIGNDFKRGYRTTEDYVLCRVEDAFLQWGNVPWAMSYFGKAKLRVHIVSDERRKHLLQEVQGLIELMQSKAEAHISYDDYVVATAPVNEKKREDKYGRQRSIPVIDHQFQQLRPMMQAVLEETKNDRIEISRAWAARPVIPLSWRT